LLPAQRFLRRGDATLVQLATDRQQQIQTKRSKFVNKTLFALAVAAMTVPAAVSAGPAAQGVSAFSTADAYSFQSGYKNGRERAYERGYREGQRDERVNSDTRVWRGEDGRSYCRRKDGTTGLLIGGAVGGLAGHEIAGGGDKTLGTIIGVAGGALLGREIDKSGSRCR
jgi:hypothetical protein